MLSVITKNLFGTHQGVSPLNINCKNLEMLNVHCVYEAWRAHSKNVQSFKNTSVVIASVDTDHYLVDKDVDLEK